MVQKKESQKNKAQTSKVGRIIFLRGKLKHLEPVEAIELVAIGMENPHILEGHMREDIKDRIEYLMGCNIGFSKKTIDDLRAAHQSLVMSGYSGRYQDW